MMSAATNKLLERNDHTDLYLAGTTTVSEAPQSASEQEELLNREISLLQFYKRVLEEARDESQPVLERLKFLAILSDNLDEFFMVRVSGLKETHEEFVGETLPGGKTADMQLRESR
jgi:polyphosphate kinase